MFFFPLTALLFGPYISSLITSLASKVVDSYISGRKRDDQGQELHKLIEEQSKMSMMDDFAKWARLDRSIAKLKALQASQSSSFKLKRMAIMGAFNVSVRAIFFIVMMYATYQLRGIPLFYFPQSKVLTAPISGLLALPTGTDGVLGFVGWIIICRSVLPRLQELVFNPSNPAQTKRPPRVDTVPLD